MEERLNQYCEKYSVRESYTIKEVIEVIDANQDRVAVVMNDNDRVIGVVSQGDIIRALTSGVNLYAQVSTIIRPSFLYETKRDMERAYSIFKRTQITMLPILDEEFHLVDIINLKNIYAYLEMREPGAGKGKS